MFEIIIKRNVVEHRIEEKECDICGTITLGKFPEGVTKSVQYGKVTIQRVLGTLASS